MHSVAYQTSRFAMQPLKPCTAIVAVEERDEGDYQILGFALEDPTGESYVAAVVIRLVLRTSGTVREAFRDESLAGGYRWEKPEQALGYAVAKGREVVTTEGYRLAY